MVKTKKKGNYSSLKVRGFTRVQLVEKGRVVGDSKWVENSLTNNGFDLYLARLVGAQSGSLQVGRVVIGTGSAPNATHTALDGELNTATYTRNSPTVSVVGSKTLRFTGTFASSDSHITAAVNVSNIGLVNNTTSGGSIMNGTTYSSSQWNTNQDYNYTYELRFA